MRVPISLDLHLPNFNYPNVAADEVFDKLVEIATTAEASGFSSVSVMDHLHQIPAVGPPENWMFEGSTMLAGLAARTERLTLGLRGRQRHLPQPGAGGQDHDHPRHHLGRPGLARRRRRLVRGGARRLRVRLPAAQGAVRAARGGTADREVDVHGRADHGRRQALPDRRRLQQPEADPRRHPDPDRRQRRAQDAAPGRPVRRRLQRVRRPRAGQAPARRARGSLRRRGTRSRRDHEDRDGR